MPELAEVIGQSNAAGRPAAGSAGRLWDTTDAVPPGIYRDDGTAWVFFGPAAGGFTNPMTDPSDIIVGGAAGAPQRLARLGLPGYLLGEKVDGSLGYMTGSWHNNLQDPTGLSGWANYNVTSGSSIASEGGAWRVRRVTSGGPETTGRSRLVPVPTAFSVATCMILNAIAEDNIGAGLHLTGTGGTHGLVGIELFRHNTDGWIIRTFEQTSTTSAGTMRNEYAAFTQGPIWFKIETTDRVTFTMSFSLDGRTFVVAETADFSAEIGTLSRAAFHARVPSALVLNGNSISASFPHWREES